MELIHIKGAFKQLEPKFNEISDALVRDCKASKQFSWLSTWYGRVDYTYSGITHRAQPYSKGFEALARKVEGVSELPRGYFNCALMNIFPKGKGIGAHADDESIFQLTREVWVRDEKVSEKTFGAVATVSIGGDAILTITENAGTNSTSTLVKSGDLYIMPQGNFQSTKKHQIGQADEKRISLTFRHTGE